MASKGKAEAYHHEPFDIDVEQALLGICLAENSKIDQAAEMLDGADFYDPLHGRVYDMIVQLQSEEAGEVTPLILHSVMKSDPGVIETGGQAYFDALRAAAPALGNIKDLARIIRDLAQRRGLIKAGGDLAAAAQESPATAPTAQLCDNFQVLVDEIASGTTAHRKRRAVRADEAGRDLLRRIEEQANAETAHGVSTGLEFLDRIIGGLFPGKVLVVAGRPGHGKSILGTNIARAAAARIPVDYLSGEMDTDELSARIGCDIDFDRAAAEKLEPLKYGDFVHLKATPGQFERMVLANDIAQDLQLEYFDVSGITLEWIEATCRRRSRQKPGHRLVIVDHLQLVELANARRGANTNEIITVITKRLKALAKELGITILLLSQLSREVEKREDKHPQVSDLREGGSIEQDADVIVGIVRPLLYARQKLQAAKNEEQRHKAILEYDEAKDVFEAAVLKNRGGRTTEYSKLFIKPESSAIRDRAPDSGQGADLIDWGKLAEDLR